MLILLILSAGDRRKHFDVKTLRYLHSSQSRLQNWPVVFVCKPHWSRYSDFFDLELVHTLQWLLLSTVLSSHAAILSCLYDAYCVWSWKMCFSSHGWSSGPYNEWVYEVSHAMDPSHRLRRFISCFCFLFRARQLECSFFGQPLLFHEVFFGISSLSKTEPSLPLINGLVSWCI